LKFYPAYQLHPGVVCNRFVVLTLCLQR
jgi:hypothetical protein